MTHLRDEELTDLVDGELPADRAAHLDDCDACRDRADLVRQSVADLRLDEIPEPSPLFWDHFSARVSDALDAPAPARASWRTRWLSVPAVAAIALVLAAGWQWTNQPTQSPTPQQAALPAAVDGSAATNEAEWELVLDVVEGAEWETVEEIGVPVNPGAADTATLQLTADEQRQLLRLLEAELASAKAL